MNSVLLSRSVLFLATTLVAPLVSARSPQVGDKAPDFTLSAVDGKTVRLANMTSQGTVVLIVLRGFPGYQCPFCNRQVQDFIARAQEFAQRGVHVLMVYPGPPQDLGGRAAEFLADKHLPENFVMLLDPGYQFTKQYGLRWDAPQETAYPSTFLIDSTGTVFFSKIVKSHGGRATAAEVLDALPKPKDGTRTEK